MPLEARMASAAISATSTGFANCERTSGELATALLRIFVRFHIVSLTSNVSLSELRILVKKERVQGREEGEEGYRRYEGVPCRERCFAIDKPIFPRPRNDTVML